METTLVGDIAIAELSALYGGYAEKIILCIAKQHNVKDGEYGVQKEVSAWYSQEDGMIATVQFVYKRPRLHDVNRQINLVLGRKAGLFLDDVPRMSWFSLKPGKDQALHIGDLARGFDLSKPEDELRVEERCARIAHDIVMAWVIKGMNWKSRDGKIHAMPYGNERSNKPRKRDQSRLSRLALRRERCFAW